MGIESALLKRDLLVQTGGRTILNITFPDEFELYVIAFELLNEKGETLKYFIFPVNPATLDESQPEITNIKKTLGGVTSLSHPGFVPPDINISGNFGRKFKILLGEDYKDFLGGFKLGPKGVFKNLFDNKVKSGYGCVKLLESIVKEAKKVDVEDGIRTLIFHNLALGNSYVVKPMSLRYSMSQESNMIWNYNLSMKGLAPLSALYTADELDKIRYKLVITGYLQNQANRLMNVLTEVIDKSLDKIGI